MNAIHGVCSGDLIRVKAERTFCPVNTTPYLSTLPTPPSCSSLLPILLLHPANQQQWRAMLSPSTTLLARLAPLAMATCPFQAMKSSHPPLLLLPCSLLHSTHQVEGIAWCPRADPWHVRASLGAPLVPRWAPLASRGRHPKQWVHVPHRRRHHPSTPPTLASRTPSLVSTHPQEDVGRG